MRDGQRLARDGQRAGARRAGVRSEAKDDVRAATAALIRGGEAQPGSVGRGRPRGTCDGNYFEDHAVAAGRRTFGQVRHAERGGVGQGGLRDG